MKKLTLFVSILAFSFFSIGLLNAQENSKDETKKKETKSEESKLKCHTDDNTMCNKDSKECSKEHKECTKDDKSCKAGDTAACKTDDKAKTETAAADTKGNQTECPIMKGSKINKKLFVDHNGERVYFCCKGCISDFKKDPDKWVKQLKDSGVTLEKVSADTKTKENNEKKESGDKK